jgi:hypothetical protein
VHVNDFLKSALREIAQKGVGIVAVWLVAHGIDVPAAVSDWVILALVGGGVALWTIVVRFLETRSADTTLGKLARGLARLLMLGIGSKPTYPPATPESAKLLGAR